MFEIQPYILPAAESWENPSWGLSFLIYKINPPTVLPVL